MKNPRWRAAVAAAIQLCALGLLACAGAQLGGRGPAAGNGPGGKPMRTATETAVGMSAAAPALGYPVTARVLVSDSLDAAPRVLFDPNTVRQDATVALSEFTPDVRGDVVAYAVSDGGTDWQVWRFRRVHDGADLPDILRFTKFWGVSWARDGS